jgi:hypothetical protein
MNLFYIQGKSLGTLIYFLKFPMKYQQKFIIKDFEHTIGNIIKWISKAHFCVHLCTCNDVFQRHYWEHLWKTSNVKLGTLPWIKLETCLKHLRGKTKDIVGIITVHNTKWIPFMTTSRIFPTMQTIFGGLLWDYVKML